MNKNLNKLVEDAIAIEAREAKEAGSLGYMGRGLVQATMPHSRVTGNEFIRKNGSFTLTIMSPSNIGLPYGSIPRLLIAWMSTEAVRTKKREITLGKSLTEFMKRLGLIPTGGRWGSIGRLKDQIRRLFSSSISFSYSDNKRTAGINMQVAEEYNLWFEPKNPNQTSLWESTVVLNQRFFDEIINSPIPLDMDVLKALKKSPMAIDIYCWLTHRMSYLKKNTEIPWEILKAQFGANYSQNQQGTRNFKKHFLKELLKVTCFYTTIKTEIGNTGLIIKPGKSHISQVVTPLFYKKKLEKMEISKKNTDDVTKKKAYNNYKLNALITILSKSVDKSNIIREFEKNLIRLGLRKNIKQLLLGDCSIEDKEDLYNFIDKHWHHLLNDIKSYTEFKKSN